jgi:hypothetical protein
MHQVSYNSRHVSVLATPSSGETVLEHFEATEDRNSKKNFTLPVVIQLAV